ncbi:hypothetical protein BKA65DRAFT_602196 [Rhexocercosporidium sp. MPI-PUGE-AT-0058]|nr:hypothetical protein BKA65DRAFT_602196 [Rhexocercosporidium sp. MPI-PUGE-AT-0058]
MGRTFTKKGFREDFELTPEISNAFLSTMRAACDDLLDPTIAVEKEPNKSKLDSLVAGIAPTFPGYGLMEEDVRTTLKLGLMSYASYWKKLKPNRKVPSALEQPTITASLTTSKPLICTPSNTADSGASSASAALHTSKQDAQLATTTTTQPKSTLPDQPQPSTKGQGDASTDPLQPNPKKRGRKSTKVPVSGTKRQRVNDSAASGSTSSLSTGNPSKSSTEHPKESTGGQIDSAEQQMDKAAEVLSPSRTRSGKSTPVPQHVATHAGDGPAKVPGTTESIQQQSGQSADTLEPLPFGKRPRSRSAEPPHSTSSEEPYRVVDRPEPAAKRLSVRPAGKPNPANSVGQSRGESAVVDGHAAVEHGEQEKGRSTGTNEPAAAEHGEEKGGSTKPCIPTVDSARGGNNQQATMTDAEHHRQRVAHLLRIRQQQTAAFPGTGSSVHKTQSNAERSYDEKREDISSRADGGVRAEGEVLVQTEGEGSGQDRQDTPGGDVSQAAIVGTDTNGVRKVILAASDGKPAASSVSATHTDREGTAEGISSKGSEPGVEMCNFLLRLSKQRTSAFSFC